MNRNIARFIASKWFAVPLVALPFACLLWTYQQVIVATEDPPSETPSAAGEVNASSEEKPPDDEGFSFTVTDEEFLEATQVVPSGESQAMSGTKDALVPKGANLNEVLTDDTGDAAIGCLIIALCLSPLRRLFPGAMLVSALNRHRRLVGLSCFFYASLHFTLYFDDGLQRLGNEWNILYIQAGLSAFAVLLVMALTSNDWSVRKLGGRRWKKLHRLVYLLIPILFYHKGWAGKGGLGAGVDQVVEALIWFSPLFALQVVRISLYFRKRGPDSSSLTKGTPSPPTP